MRYESTRGGVRDIRFTDAVMMGLAEDGGLLVPSEIPQLSGSELVRLSKLSYRELAYEIIRLYVDDISSDVLRGLIYTSYDKFDTKEIIPVQKGGGVYIAELFHGPTYAFKDIALQFLGNLFEYILDERGKTMNILGATSGDTGSAAIEGVRGRKNMNIFILYPAGRVSPVQELQMTTVDDPNVFNFAVNGTFDDCQDIVKSIFGELSFKRRHNLGSINSINWARVLAQVVYYFWVFFRVEADTMEENIHIVVPTGNFGNIFAGYLAKQMGLPLGKLILATNENNILARFIKNGDYSMRDVIKTHSPSMDIQVASNFERYLYLFSDRDAEITRKMMKKLKESRKLHFSSEELEAVQRDFATYSATNDETILAIRNYYESTGYILDPHTATGVVAAKGLQRELPGEMACLATAHPAKFPDVVEKAITIGPESPEGIKALANKPRRSVKTRNSVEEIKRFITHYISQQPWQ